MTDGATSDRRPSRKEIDMLGNKDAVATIAVRNLDGNILSIVNG